MKRTLDWDKYLETSARAVSGGIVMLKNDGALPLKQGGTAAVFGRIQLHYYKSGTGSGGMVNVSKVIGITDGLLDAGYKLDEQLLNAYREWDEQNPFDYGEGWGGEPWSQKEMPLTDELVGGAASRADAAIVIIGRTAGEEMDNKLEKGAFLLSDLEEDMRVRQDSCPAEHGRAYRHELYGQVPGFRGNVRMAGRNGRRRRNRGSSYRRGFPERKAPGHHRIRNFRLPLG